MFHFSSVSSFPLADDRSMKGGGMAPKSPINFISHSVTHFKRRKEAWRERKRDGKRTDEVSAPVASGRYAFDSFLLYFKGFVHVF